MRSRRGRFRELKITSIAELHDFQRTRWAFRGHSSRSYRLQSTLERVYSPAGWKLDELPKLERALLREFKRHYFQYDHREPPVDDTLEWLSIMQHHGAPTRLLDFTYSVYIAMYFALEGALSSDGADGSEIWALNVNWAEQAAASMFPKRSTEARFIRATLDNKDRRTFDAIAMGDRPKRLVMIVNPFHRNERLSIQQGAFACPADVRATFEENLHAMPGAHRPENVMRLVLPAALRNEGMMALYYMGITSRSLFPGLDGFARSLRHTMPLLWRQLVHRKKSRGRSRGTSKGA